MSQVSYADVRVHLEAENEPSSAARKAFAQDRSVTGDSRTVGSLPAPGHRRGRGLAVTPVRQDAPSGADAQPLPSDDHVGTESGFVSREAGWPLGRPPAVTAGVREDACLGPCPLPACPRPRA